MDKRSTESPMDFEWQTRAPGDVTSPFYQLSIQHENQKKRPHGVFGSPTRKPLPSLREPNSQSFLFSQTPSTTAATPPSSPSRIFSKTSFTTPRKVDIDFSSGAENFSSPENADNDETPDQPAKKEKRNSLFGMYGRFAPSSGRGEIPRLNNYSNALVRRVQKKRRRDRDLDRRLRRDSEGDSERPSSSEGKQAKGPQQPPTSRLSSFSDFFALLEAHPNMPSILSWWAQLVVNLVLFSLAVSVVFAFVSAIRAEFDQAAAEVSDTILADMAACAKSYVDNRCAGGGRLPALETVCENWERCMNRDPAKVGRAKVSAHTMAVIINSFIDPISWKAILCFLATISTVTVVSNWSFRSFRNRLNQHDYMPTAPVVPRPPHQYYQPLSAGQLPLSSVNADGEYFGSQTTALPRSQVSPSKLSLEKRQDDRDPLMIEDSHTQSMPFVTERSRERESHLRTPSPSKKTFQ
ncbi:hypothetical protein Egran_04649 [Elaphomyces granulatus]|uniref:Brl1/Brr6 domain-containing protein n=1 Tax=Elaphomyces granulatus TaxID=519963 RepID=A0A232LTV6_9EURO|nr:hypothetical protein Egran_04649 [Elaphomyces granulatus]